MKNTQFTYEWMLSAKRDLEFCLCPKKFTLTQCTLINVSFTWFCEFLCQCMSVSMCIFAFACIQYEYIYCCITISTWYPSFNRTLGYIPHCFHSGIHFHGNFATQSDFTWEAFINHSFVFFYFFYLCVRVRVRVCSFF